MDTFGPTKGSVSSPIFLPGASVSETHRYVSEYLDIVSSDFNFRVAKTFPIGRPGKGDKGTREFRLQLIDPHKDTSAVYKPELLRLLTETEGVTNVQFNTVSPNSSKFSSVSFTVEGTKRIDYDAVVAKGANKGEVFEKRVVSDLQRIVAGAPIEQTYVDMFASLEKANKKFRAQEVVQVQQRVGSTKKLGVPLERLGEVIGDFILIDKRGDRWYTSLKDINGDTFSSYHGASSIMDANGTVLYDTRSIGLTFLDAFGVDLNLIQAGFDARQDLKVDRPAIPVGKADERKMRAILERCWGLNYFYLRRSGSTSWKSFWIDKQVLGKLSSGLKVDRIEYPSKASKQIGIHCGNGYASYLVTIRNSQGGEWPNDIKFRTKKLNIG